MTRFAALFAAIDATTSTNSKVEAMAQYLAEAPAADAAWAVFFLTGRRLKRLVPGRAIGDWALAATGLDDWLLGECYAVVGDGAETAALILDHLPSTPAPAVGLAEWIETRVMPLRVAAPAAQRERVIGWMGALSRWERFTLLKLLTGELRVGVSQTLVVRALAQVAALPATTMAARLMGEWTPSAAWYLALVAPGVTDADRSRPYPFALASPVDGAVAGAEGIAALLGTRSDWQVEWKWDGIRAQLVRRGGAVYLWSRGEELVTDRFPKWATTPPPWPTAPCSTARCWPSSAIGRCPSSPCSSASAARATWPAPRAPSRWFSWPTTCSNTTAATCVISRSRRGGRCSTRS